MCISRLIFFTVFSLALSSCASKPSRPSLYPNQMFKERGDKANVDIDECLKASEEYLQTPEGQKLAENSNTTSIGTSIGFGMSSGGASGIGIGLGVGSGRTSQLSGEEQVRRNFTNQCLVNKGYQIVGWN
jgi:outer membrane lipoprotein SlyB